MSELRLSKNCVINVESWENKTQKEFVDYFSDRVPKTELVNHYKQFGKAKTRKKKVEEVDDKPIQDS